MTSLFFLAASYALLALALCFTLSSVISAKETNLQSVLVGLKIISSLLVWRTVLRAARFLSVLAVGMALGWTAKDQYDASRMHTLYNVTFVSQGPNPREFRILKPEDTEAAHTVFCEDVPFKPGMRVKMLKYEDKTYCWSVKGSQARYYIAQGDNDHGFNADPHANPYPNTYANAFPYAPR